MAVATVAGLVSAGAVHVGAAPEVRLVDAGNPLAGQPFYVDPASAAMAAARNANPPSPQLTAVANTPQAYWLDQAFPAGSVGARVAGYTGAAQAAGSMPIFALYGIPHRDCGSYASGGFASGRTTASGSTASRPAWAARRRRSSSNPMHSTWPTACRLTSARNASI
ncbi:endoglucanase A [Mycobacterium kansasii]|uniref:Endoglucanase A n=1 Tax=Mycobacterium kansasii TaxID=1768 RepID=A0A1V3XBB4_MYCKA|nr:endoglucanase A [Mycobacterium kansasii]